MTMPRALAAFRHQGIDAIAAPTDFTPGLGEDSRGTLSELEVHALELLPNPVCNALKLSHFTGVKVSHSGLVLSSVLV